MRTQHAEAYREEGYTIVRGMFSSETVHNIKNELSAIGRNASAFEGESIQYEDNYEDIRRRSDNPLDWIRKVDYPAMSTSSYLMSLFQDRESPLVKMAEQLIGAEDLAIVFLTCFAKPPRSGAEIPWHQDQALWHLWMDTALSGWVALDECTDKNGCLQFVPGSHKWGMQPHRQYEGKIHESIRIADYPEAQPEKAYMEPGDVAFFGGKVWHFSEANRSDKRRLAVPACYASGREIQTGLQCNDWLTSKLALEKPLAPIPLEPAARDYFANRPLVE